MAVYRLLETKNDAGAVYGVEAARDGAVIRYEAVTDDRAAMERLVALCNTHGLALCHLEDVLEDFLTDFRV